MRKTILLCAFFCALCPLMFSAEKRELKPFTMPTTRGYGMGGSHVAFADDVFSLFVNPAALMRSNQKSFFELSLGVYGPIIELLKATSGAKTGGDNAMVEAIGNIAGDGKIPLGGSVRGPLAIGYVANGLGFGLWNHISTDAKIVGTDMEVNFSADAIINFGMAFNIFTFGSHTLDAGFVTKVVARGMGGIDENLLNFIGSSTFLNDLTVPLLLGAGLDLGVTYRWRILDGNTFSAAIVADDLPTFVGKVGAVYGKGAIPKYVIYPRVNIGAAYTVDFSEFTSVPIQLAGALDYYDISRWFTPNDFTKRNPILNLSFGLEATFFKIISVRTGLNDMLPAVGLGFNFKGFRIDGAMYGKELGVEPGQLAAYAFDLSISVRPESKKRDWAWTRPIFGGE